MLDWVAQTPGLFIIPFLAGILFISGKIIWSWADDKSIPSWWNAILILLVVAARIPATLFNSVTNVDEAQTLAHALTIIQSPVPWGSLDFTTNGPLNAYIFFVPYWLGFKIDFLTSHIILLIIQAIICLALYVSMRNWFGRANALVAMIPVWIFLALVQAYDFIHQSSEIWSCMCISIALAIFSGVTTRENEKGTVWKWLLIGFFLGLAPFGKPQGAPPALMAALGIFIYIISQYHKIGTTRLTIFLLGGFTAPAIVLGAVLAHSVWNDFIDLYVRANLHYAAIHGGGAIPWFIITWGKSNGVAYFFYASVLLFLFGAFSKKGYLSITPTQKWLGIWLVAITYLGAYAVQRAGRHFPHYMLLFLFPGVFLLLGWIVSFWQTHKNRKIALSIAFSALAVIALHKNRDFYGMISEGFSNQKTWELKISPTAEFVKKHTKKGDYITVYGWSNEYYVQTQMPSATRMVTIYQHTNIWPELYEPYYKNDLERNKPAVFIDALDNANEQADWISRTKHDPAEYEWLYSFLNTNYILANVIESNKIYIRRDRLKMQ